MEGTYPIKLNGENAGSLEISKQGCHYRFCACAENSGEVLRLAAICGDGAVSIGIPVPDEGKLCLDRLISKNELERMGLSEIEGVILLPADAPLSAVGTAQTDESAEAEAIDGTGSAEPSEAAENSGMWVPENEPGKYFSDEAVGEMCRGMEGVLRHSGKGFTRLAIPSDIDVSFPISAFLRMGSGTSIDGREYKVITIRGGKD